MDPYCDGGRWILVQPRSASRLRSLYPISPSSSLQSIKGLLVYPAPPGLFLSTTQPYRLYSLLIRTHKTINHHVHDYLDENYPSSLAFARYLHQRFLHLDA